DRLQSRVGSSARNYLHRHCEPVEAIHVPPCGAMDCFAALAMTASYRSASIHSAAPRHSVSRCSGLKNPMCPILLAPVSAGITVMISGLIEVNPEHSHSTAGRVAQGSSDMQSARNAPL